MRAFLAFLAIIVVTLLAAALLAYPVYLALHPHFPEWWFDKVATRLWQALMLVAIVTVVRRLKLRGARDYGYGAPRPRWLRQFGIGLLAGLVTMLPLTVSMLALGVRVVRPELDLHLLLGALVAGIGSGLAIGFLEETFFRGLMLGAVVRDLKRPMLAILLVAMVYASVHFLASTRIPPEAVTWRSGLSLLHASIGNFIAPGGIIDAWLALLAVGVLLGTCAWWTGNIAVGVGLHASWVFVMRATIGVTRENPASPLEWLINPTFGYIGWLVLAWTLLLFVVMLAMRSRFRGWHRTF